MQGFDPALETRVLKTVLDRGQQSLLANYGSEWFGFPVAQEIWKRLLSLRQNGKAIPTSLTLSTDPVLSEKAQSLLKGDVPPLQDYEVESVMGQLDRFRQGRLIFGMLHHVTELCKPNDADLLKAKLQIENCLSLLQSPDAADEILNYGIQNEQTFEFYESVMALDIEERFIPTGYRIIDSQQGGVGRGRLYTIGADSGGGKSTWANDLSIRMYGGGHKVGYVSMEMNREECLLRTQANITRIPHDKFNLKKLTVEERMRSDKTLAKFLAQGEQKGAYLDYICPKRDITIPQLFGMIEHKRYDALMLDYLNLFAPIDPKRAMWENIGEAFRLGKRFAERMNCALFMLVQIDEETGGVKYAKSIKHHSDGVWIWRYGDEEKESRQIEINQIKLRNFAPLKFKMQTDFEYCAFTEIDGRQNFEPAAPNLQPMSF